MQSVSLRSCLMPVISLSEYSEYYNVKRNVSGRCPIWYYEHYQLITHYSVYNAPHSNLWLLQRTMTPTVLDIWFAMIHSTQEFSWTTKCCICLLSLEFSLIIVNYTDICSNTSSFLVARVAVETQYENVGQDYPSFLAGGIDQRPQPVDASGQCNYVGFSWYVSVR